MGDGRWSDSETVWATAFDENGEMTDVRMKESADGDFLLAEGHLDEQAADGTWAVSDIQPDVPHDHYDVDGSLFHTVEDRSYWGADNFLPHEEAEPMDGAGLLGGF